MSSFPSFLLSNASFASVVVIPVIALGLCPLLHTCKEGWSVKWRLQKTYRNISRADRSPKHVLYLLLDR